MLPDRRGVGSDGAADTLAGMHGAPCVTSMREVMNALNHMDSTGCQWRALDDRLPPASTVCHCFHIWQRLGVLGGFLRVLQRQHPQNPAARSYASNQQRAPSLEDQLDNLPHGLEHLEQAVKHSDLGRERILQPGNQALLEGAMGNRFDIR